jgi:hypothetical protein
MYISLNKFDYELHGRSIFFYMKEYILILFKANDFPIFSHMRLIHRVRVRYFLTQTVSDHKMYAICDHRL